MGNGADIIADAIDYQTSREGSPRYNLVLDMRVKEKFGIATPIIIAGAQKEDL
jgi:hypothetical protein